MPLKIYNEMGSEGLYAYMENTYYETLPFIKAKSEQLPALKYISLKKIYFLYFLQIHLGMYLRNVGNCFKE